MDEELKRLIRIDPHKVQQKVYDLYPMNSTVRRTVISEAKAKEIEHLSHALSDMPVQVAQDAVKKNTQLLFLSLGCGISLLLLGSAFATYAFFLNKTFVEQLFGLMLAGVSYFSSISYIKNAFDLHEVSSAFLASVDSIKNKINELKK